MTKTFNIVGVSRVRADGPLKVRVANGDNTKGRTRVLERAGNVDIQLFAVAPPVTKEGAIAFLAERGLINTAETETPVSAETETTETETPATAAETTETEEETEVEVSPAAKLAIRRAKDAARKRAKRAAEKAARQAA